MLKPKCHRQKGIAYVSTGHLLPCCWCDTMGGESKAYFIGAGFFNEELKLENNNTVEDILISDVWTDFHRRLIENPEDAPRCCKQKCGTKYENSKWLKKIENEDE